ncbi:MAG: ribonuclease D [Parvibaculaceae bacterium]
MEIITKTKDLEALCAALARENYVTVDTEFMREQTFWPILCLIQIAGSGREAIIDPLAESLDLEAFYALMDNPAVLKVFHAARQDVEILFLKSGRIPHPLFDTQIAAMVCGFGDQVGYEALTRQLAGVQIDKSSRFTDWSHRPLSERQLAYALSDVTHLRKIYDRLKAQLDRTGREPWLEEEMAVLTSPDTYRSDPADAWKRTKFRARNRRQQAVIMEVAAWREREAQARDVPRSRVLKDDAMVEIAMQAPSTDADLKRLRALPRGYAGSRFGDGILAAVKRALERPAKDVSMPENGSDGRQEGTSATVEVLRLALKIVCESEGIAPKLIAGTSDLEAIAGGATEGVPALTGWRRGIFGEAALRLVAGELDIGLEDGKPVLREATRAMPRPQRAAAGA